MAPTRQYARNTRIYLEILILVATATTLGLAIPYTANIWNANSGTETPTPSRASLLPLYGLPPFLTILISALNIFIYLYSTQPFIYNLCVTSLASAGWLVTALFWGHCGFEASGESLIRWSPKICYQRHVPGYEIGVLGICAVVGSAVVLLCHLYGFCSAAQDLYHFRRGTLRLRGGLQEVTEDMEKRLRLRYSSFDSVQSQDSTHKRSTSGTKRDLKQVTEDMEKRLRMRYVDDGLGVVMVEEDTEDMKLPRR